MLKLNMRDACVRQTLKTMRLVKDSRGSILGKGEAGRFNSTDQALLAKHEIRKTGHGWGQGEPQKFPRVPQEGSWCKGGSRYVEG